jgi:hypothetical protein
MIIDEILLKRGSSVKNSYFRDIQTIDALMIFLNGKRQEKSTNTINLFMYLVKISVFSLLSLFPGFGFGSMLS